MFFSTFKESTLAPVKLAVTSVAPLADKEGFTVSVAQRHKQVLDLFLIPLMPC